VRVNAQLVDAEVDRHVWAERYDRQLVDVFELQDEIVASIGGTVAPEITLAEIDRTRAQRPNTLSAWDRYLRALAAYHRMTKDDMAAAISHLEIAVDADPRFGNAYALMSLCYSKTGEYGWAQPARRAYEKAHCLAEKAIRLTPSSPETNHALAYILIVTGQAEDAVSALRRALQLNPNFFEAEAALGLALVFCGDLEGGLAACQRAARSSPRDRRGSWVYDGMGHAYFMLGNYDRAIEVSKQGLREDPSDYGALVRLAGCYARLGRKEEAKRYVDDLLHMIPRYSLRALRKNPMFVDPELIEKLVDSMRLAGLPE
jgi:adenylate cyclase